MSEDLLLHAGCVRIGGRGLLIMGASGRGKSDLALRLIDRGALLVSDDYTTIAVAQERLVARAPERLAGLLEARGVGIVAMAAAGPTPLALALDLDRAPDRLPESDSLRLGGIDLPRIGFSPFEASAPVKAEMALTRFGLSLETWT